MPSCLEAGGTAYFRQSICEGSFGRTKRLENHSKSRLHKRKEGAKRVFALYTTLVDTALSLLYVSKIPNDARLDQVIKTAFT